MFRETRFRRDQIKLDYSHSFITTVCSKYADEAYFPHIHSLRSYRCAGAYLWTLKDKIDRDWMRGYQQLPGMEEMAAMALLKKAQTGGGAHSAHKVCALLYFGLWHSLA
jgi:hypothetical protein